MIRVNLLGTLAIFGPDGEVDLPAAKTRPLAAYLFWHRGEWIQRAELAGLLWPNSDEERAAHNLRQALYQLRKELTIGGQLADYLEIRREFVRINPHLPCRVDAKLFEENAQQGLNGHDDENIAALTLAADLYHGDFLRDMDSEWCNTERRRLADLHIVVLRGLVERLTKAALYDVALPHARRWVALDPLDEAAHQALMVLHANLNQPGKVVTQFEECRRILKAELDVPPSETTIHLFRRLGRAAGDGASRHARPAPNRGRTKGRARTPARPKFSDQPMVDARMLLTYAVSQAEAGDTAALKAMQASIATYERLGDREAQAKARLILGQQLLATQAGWLGRHASGTLRPALAYLQETGSSSELRRALTLYAQAMIHHSKTGEAIKIATEGIAMAQAAGDHETEMRMNMILASAYRSELRLGEARQVISYLTEVMPTVDSTEDVIRILFETGTVLCQCGDLTGAEAALSQVTALTPLVASPTTGVKYYDWLAQCSLGMVRRYRGLNRADGGEAPTKDTDTFALHNMSPLFATFSSEKGDARAIASTCRWIRVKWDEWPANYIVAMVWLLVERMVSAQMLREAAAWAAAGIRLAAHHHWPGWEAALSARRAVALARLGRTSAAKASLRRCASTIDSSDVITMAWSAWAEGLISLGRKHRAGAVLLASTRDLFESLGDHLDAESVTNDLARMTVPVD